MAFLTQASGLRGEVPHQRPRTAPAGSNTPVASRGLDDHGTFPRMGPLLRTSCLRSLVVGPPSLCFSGALLTGPLGLVSSGQGSGGRPDGSLHLKATNCSGGRQRRVHVLPGGEFTVPGGPKRGTGPAGRDKAAARRCRGAEAGDARDPGGAARTPGGGEGRASAVPARRQRDEARRRSCPRSAVRGPSTAATGSRLGELARPEGAASERAAKSARGQTAIPTARQPLPARAGCAARPNNHPTTPPPQLPDLSQTADARSPPSRSPPGSTILAGDRGQLVLQPSPRGPCGGRRLGARERDRRFCGAGRMRGGTRRGGGGGAAAAGQVPRWGRDRAAPASVPPANSCRVATADDTSLSPRRPVFVSRGSDTAGSRNLSGSHERVWGPPRSWQVPGLHPLVVLGHREKHCASYMLTLYIGALLNSLLTSDSFFVNSLEFSTYTIMFSISKFHFFLFDLCAFYFSFLPSAFAKASSKMNTSGKNG